VSAPLSLTLDVTAVPPRPAGAGRYTVELASALAQRSDVELTLLARRADTGRWSDAALLAAAPDRVLGVAPSPRPLRLAWEQLALGRLLDREGPDVHHGPHYTMPERTRRPVVVTIHDCTFFDHPEWHERSKAVLFRRAIRVAAVRASVLVCVSRTTAERLVEVCEVRAPVVVAPHGVDHDRFSPEEPSPGSDALALGAIGVDTARPYIAFVGTLEPRKGVADLVAAFDRLASRHPELALVVAGQPGWGDTGIEEALAGSSARGRIVLPGYVPDGTVAPLLRQASAVAYPSIEEGYGLPALEALACGAPLVTTRGTAMEEVAGDAAWLVAPRSPEELAGALDAVLSGAEDTAAHRALGLAEAARRTWSASAERHLAAYRLASGERALAPTDDGPPHGGAGAVR